MPDPFADLKAKVDDPTPLMKQWGAMMVSESVSSFRNQCLGDIQWPARYEGMPDPFINIAGTIQDFNAGRDTPKPNRFQRRPANVDEGQRGGLKGSITFEVEAKDMVRVGSNKSTPSRAGGRAVRGLPDPSWTAENVGLAFPVGAGQAVEGQGIGPNDDVRPRTNGVRRGGRWVPRKDRGQYARSSCP